MVCAMGRFGVFYLIRGEILVGFFHNFPYGVHLVSPRYLINIKEADHTEDRSCSQSWGRFREVGVSDAHFPDQAVPALDNFVHHAHHPWPCQQPRVLSEENNISWFDTTSAAGCL